MEVGLLRRRSVLVLGDAWQVHIAHTVVAAQLVGGPRTMHAPMLERVDEIGDLEGKIDVLLHEDDGDAALGEADHDLEDLVDHQRREAERRLVEQQKLGVPHQRPADRQHLLLAAGKPTGRLSVSLAEDRKQSIDFVKQVGPRLAASGEEPCNQILLDRKMLKYPPS